MFFIIPISLFLIYYGHLVDPWLCFVVQYSNLFNYEFSWTHCESYIYFGHNMRNPVWYLYLIPHACKLKHCLLNLCHSCLHVVLKKFTMSLPHKFVKSKWFIRYQSQVICSIKVNCMHLSYSWIVYYQVSSLNDALIRSKIPLYRLFL